MIECYDEYLYSYYSMLFGVFLFSIILLVMLMGIICIIIEKIKEIFKKLLTNHRFNDII